MLQTPFRKAVNADAPEIAAVVNAANSGDGGKAGWTHEADYFDGERTNTAEVQQMIAVPQSLFLLYVDGGAIAGSVYLKGTGKSAYMGILAVRPTLQTGGVGKQLIAECERIAHEIWHCELMRISVITSHRPELTAWYERRGYVRTGKQKDFERRQVLDGLAKVDGLRLEWMEKKLGHA
jgi:N-acetylglutamate synthase-like GNAT family acetyltransferase